jgi:hypothetical protein
MNKWGLAVKETIFQFAVLHILMIAFQAIRTGDFQLVHLASILDLHFFFDNVPYTVSSNLLLYVPVTLLLLVNFLVLRRKNPEPKGLSG